MKSVHDSYQRRELKTFQIHELEEMKVAANDKFVSDGCEGLI